MKENQEKMGEQGAQRTELGSLQRRGILISLRVELFWDRKWLLRKSVQNGEKYQISVKYHFA